ncbi:DUF6379 domain-containing protein [Demequina sp. SYSU T00039]|uniref:C-deglycosylation enzyme beta subunit n=1 Tax=Demequina lignilytica TaxID=3051663 RepID=A0AAW7M4Y3_9MICO|nr:MULTISPECIES: DUF6379 domain-containing protein [unclassified Demequina]MDN4477923.1 DUF6379 domain-containing protein [Demequina sp. SYSU T00039-1]MDN4487832.1 DUF6379 domain-containing protein [Demequina sp. SYSU T00039]MDN4490785.1 DUF6379 domain-containing protein [Demequina sp. SYSU T00068]
MATSDSLINDSSLRVHPDGVAVSLQLPWYRSLWLSAVNSLELTIDGVPVPSDRLRLELDGTAYPVEGLRERFETLWFLEERPLLVATLEEPLALGTTHEVEVTADLTIVYMQIKPGLYVPNRVSMTRTLEVVDLGAPPPALRVDEVPAPVDRSDLPFKLGTTLYSATAELAAGQYTLETLLDRVAEAGIGPGIEIVASQSLRDYPVVTEEFATNWERIFDKHGFEASSFGANLDLGRRRDRDMTPDEEFEFSKTLFEGAKRLGFPLVRIQSAKPELLRRLLPLAEDLELKMAYEIHAPEGPNSPKILEVRETYAELDSPLLGFVADFSSTMRAMAPVLLTALGRMGLDTAALDRLQQIWATDASMFERQEEFAAYLTGRGIDPMSLAPFNRLAFNMQGTVPVEEWLDIMPQILHVHAKFYDIDAHGDEPSIDYPALARIFMQGGYQGFWSSEYEGHAFADLGEVDPIALVRQQHDLIARSLLQEVAR